MAVHEIKTPRGRVYHGPSGSAILEWNTRFKDVWLDRFKSVQGFVDAVVLDRCEPFTPLKTGMLIMSGTLGTVVGSGTVRYIAPYSRYQYYMVNRKTPSQTGPLRGSFWFERMKQVYGRAILAEAKRRMRKGTP